MTQPQVSIVMGSYNGARYIERQLNSLVNQTVPPHEILVADDGSTDETMEIVAAIAAKSAVPIRLWRNPENLGYGENFLQTALKATGDLIAYCDQDDIWRPTKLEKCIPEFADPNVVMVVHQAGLIDGEDNNIGGFDQGISESRTVPPLSYDQLKCFYGFSIMIRRDLLAVIPPNLRGTDPMSGAATMAHDRWTTFLANLAGSTREIAEELVDYRQHNDNLCGAPVGRFYLGNASTIRTWSDIYVRAAREQRALLDRIEPEVMVQFPQLDIAAAKALRDAVVKKGEGRDRVYQARGRIGALARIVGNLFNGTYVQVGSGRFMAQRLAKDVLFIGMRRD
ncbi:glycosyltransferase [Sphingobium subterraneum]|uniref:Glycosyltransferase involved in cell wall biosynthesis n=1 Tax=Sphingobium subterraneum TaxID=627688 RepID=A0A841IZC4_9SPHN|nr:glycosyltransferase [Sphingobium subterraneum]MBB6123472.1 glycosyltransferase involved in cell wall biosynthesis [Sphingobium subterraneum]